MVSDYHVKLASPTAMVMSRDVNSTKPFAQANLGLDVGLGRKHTAEEGPLYWNFPLVRLCRGQPDSP